MTFCKLLADQCLQNLSAPHHFGERGTSLVHLTAGLRSQDSTFFLCFDKNKMKFKNYQHLNRQTYGLSNFSLRLFVTMIQGESSTLVHHEKKLNHIQQDKRINSPPLKSH